MSNAKYATSATNDLKSIVDDNSAKKLFQSKQTNIATRINRFLNVLFAIVVMAGCALLSGCGSHTKGEDYDYQYSGRGYVRFGYTGAGIELNLNVMESLYADCYCESFDVRDPVVYDTHMYHAFSKRRAALNLSRQLYGYSFQNYVILDGVSGFIYNFSYLMQIPHKLLRGMRCMDGPVRYVKSVIYLGIGAVFAIVGCVAAPVINTICHPIETLANLTVGILPINVFGITDDTHISIGQYIFRTNIIASLWDLTWGGIVYPLWQALTFWW